MLKMTSVRIALIAAVLAAAAACHKTPKIEPVAPTAEELRALLAQHKGNVAAVGREFGKERMQVHRWMKRYGIDVDEYR